MKITTLAAFAAACLMLAACNGLAGVGSLSGPSPVASAASHTTADERARAGAHEAYNLVTKAFLLANKEGIASPQLKALAKRYLGTKGAATLADAAVERAYRAANSQDLASQAQEVLRLVGEVKALVPASALQKAQADIAAGH